MGGEDLQQGLRGSAEPLLTYLSLIAYGQSLCVQYTYRQVRAPVSQQCPIRAAGARQLFDRLTIETPEAYLISKTVTGFVATSRRSTTSHLPSSSSSSTTSFSLPFVLATGALFSSSAVCAVLLGPATRVKLATKALRGAPRLAGAFEALRTAWIVGVDDVPGENLFVSLTRPCQ